MEEAFYVYENNQLVRVPGHFIYYEKMIRCRRI